MSSPKPYPFAAVSSAPICEGLMFQFKMQEDISALFQRFPDVLKQAVATDIQRQSLYFIGHIQKTQMTGRPGLNVQTGKLRRDWFAKTGIVNGVLTVRVWSTTKYLPTHEFGATIRPKTARALRFKVGGRWVFAQEVTIPRRLRLRDAFQHEALTRYAAVFKRVFGNRGKFKGAKKYFSVGPK